MKLSRVWCVTLPIAIREIENRGIKLPKQRHFELVDIKMNLRTNL